MNSRYIISLDQGTTSSRAILFDQSGKIIDAKQKEFKQIFPKPGWVEHDPKDIWESQLDVLTELILSQDLKQADVAAIGITNQRETTIVWDKNTGIPIYNAIVWQDRRTSNICDQLKKAGYTEKIRRKTGLVIDAYFSATKIKWILDHVDGAREKEKHGDLIFGTVDTWLLWKLTNGKHHVTDVTNASRTMLYNIDQLLWDEELCSVMDIPLAILPEVRECSEHYGNTDKSVVGMEIPISGIAGDQQAALFGQMCVHPGSAKNTYGTGCFLVLNTGKDLVYSNNNLLSTIAWKVNVQINYALEGSVFVAGAAIQWLRDGLEIIQSAAETESIANEVEDNGGVYFVPALSGLGAPHWDQYARGTIVGLTRGTKKAHIIRAALESIALQVNDVVEAMESDTGTKIDQLRVDGGAVENDLLLQFQADILAQKVIRPKILETTALGAAYLAGLAVGFWKSIDEISSQWAIDKEFIPVIEMEGRAKIKEEWSRAIERSKRWIAD